MGGSTLAGVAVQLDNPEKSPLISDLLSEIAELAKRQGVATESQSAADARHDKGEIVSTLLLGISSAGAYDLLKAVVMRFCQRKDYDEDASVVINQVVVNLRQLQPGSEAPE